MTTRSKARSTRRAAPAGRTGQPVRASSRLRRVELGCGHGWVRDPVAGVHDWVWCDGCADWARVQRVEE
jgi:hypothetical protein